MNMVLHGILDFKMEYGDTLSYPKLVEGCRLKTYDRVLANFLFSMDWDNKLQLETHTTVSGLEYL
jgi:type I restriction-modification system DNA methylase subunit